MFIEPVLIAGAWRASESTGTFQSTNPATGEVLQARYPISSWADCEAALDAAEKAFAILRTMSGDAIATFLETYATKIEQRAEELVVMANQETALPLKPRLADGELPRTTGQLRLAAAAARSQSWRQATIDSAAGIRSCFAPIGPVAVFGPNNFPFAFGSISGGDFAAAIAAGNPVIAKANSSHPGTTRIFAEAAQEAATETGMPAGTVQLLYRTSHSIGEQLVTDERLGATGYTGSREAGLVLKRAADAAGKPIYLELSSINPVVFLPGSLAERSDELAEEFVSSCLMGTGQFCTNPGLLLLLDGETTENFITDITRRFDAAPAGTLLSPAVEKSLHASHHTLTEAGAAILCGTGPAAHGGCCSVKNTLLRCSADSFLRDSETMQTEAFGNSSLIVTVADLDQAAAVIAALEGNLTGVIYSAKDGSDDAAYRRLEPILRQKVGRLLNDKMPTGVAVSSAMNHGGPYPSTGHPGFTAVGIPASIHRFTALHCYDNVRSDRLPEILRDDYAGSAQRLIDGVWR